MGLAPFPWDWRPKSPRKYKTKILFSPRIEISLWKYTLRSQNNEMTPRRPLHQLNSPISHVHQRTHRNFVSTIIILAWSCKKSRTYKACIRSVKCWARATQAKCTRYARSIRAIILTWPSRWHRSGILIRQTNTVLWKSNWGCCGRD